MKRQVKTCVAKLLADEYDVVIGEILYVKKESCSDAVLIQIERRSNVRYLFKAFSQDHFFRDIVRITLSRE